MDNNSLIGPNESTTRFYKKLIPNGSISLENFNLILNKVTNNNSINIGPFTTGLVYNSFFFEEETNSIYTHDSITHLSTSDLIEGISNNTGNILSPNFFVGSSNLTTINDILIAELNGTYRSSNPRGIYNINCFPEGYIYLAYPEMYGTVSFKVSGIYTNQFVSSIFTINSTRYIVYKSINKQYSSNVILEAY